MLITIALLGVYGLALYQLFIAHPGLSPDFVEIRMSAYFGADSIEQGVRTLIVMVGAIGLLNTIWISTLIRQFRSRTAPEVFFFMMFLATVSLDLVKPLTILTAELPVPLLYSGVITRLVYFGYVFGMLCLFCSSLAVSVIDSKRTGTVLALAVMISAAFAYVIPVDATQLYPSLVYRIGLQGTANATVGAISGFAVLTFLHAGIAATDREYAILGAAVALAVIGRHAVFHVPQPVVLLLGTTCLIAGSVLFGRRSHRRYLWQ